MVSGAPYASRTTGEYAVSGTVNGAPGYQRTDQYGLTWSLYRRSYGRWVLDFNAVDEQWSGTVAYSDTQGASSVLAASGWSISSMSIVQASASPPPPPASTSVSPVYASGSIPYPSRTVGVYRPTGSTYGGAPVYQRTDRWGLVWSLYRRTYGTWVFDFNAVDDQWSGTVAYSHADSATGVTDATWAQDIAVTDVSSGAAALLESEANKELDASAPAEAPREEAPPPQKPDPHYTEELHDVAEEAPAARTPPPPPASPPAPRLPPSLDASSHDDAINAAHADESPMLPLSVLLASASAALLVLLALFAAACACRRRVKMADGETTSSKSAKEPAPKGVKIASSGDVEVRVSTDEYAFV